MDYSLLVGVADPTTVAMHASQQKERTINQRGVFRRFSGAVCATDEDDSLIDDCAYYLAIIDFAQPFNMRKRGELAFKSTLVNDARTLSVAQPTDYSTRLISFVQRICDPSLVAVDHLPKKQV